MRPPPPPAKTEADLLAEDVSRLSAAAEALLREQDERIWAAWTAGQPAHLEESYAGYEALFTPEAIQKIDRLRRLRSDPAEVRALTHLQAHFVGEYLSAALGDLNEAVANLEGSLTFSAGGKEHPYRSLPRLLASEPNTARRRALYSGATEAVQRLSATLRRREARIGELISSLGYPSYEAFGAELRQVDLERLGFLAEELLQLTQPAYEEVMDKLARRELALPLASLKTADFPRLFQPRGVDAEFPADGLRGRTWQTVKGLGIDLDALNNLKVDGEARKGKDPRPLAVAPRIPIDVRLSLVPSGGVRLEAALLHEVGHVLHFAFTREPRFELAKLGGNAQAEAFAYLFEDLVEDPIWLEEQTGLTGERLATYLYATSAQKLFRLRRAAGQLLYQLELRRRGGEEGPALFVTHLSRAYGIQLTAEDAERHLVELEDFYESADEFRAWFLAAQLQNQLKARFGPRWWASAEAGAFLREQWAHGNARSGREVAVAIGEPGIRTDVLLLRLATTLKVPIRIGTQAPAVMDEPARQDTEAAPSDDVPDGGP